MKIAVQGLGRMGLQIVRKLVEDGHEVIAMNRSQAPIDEAVSYGAIAAHTKQDVIAEFGDKPTVIWIMLPAEIVEAQSDDWSTLLPPKSIIIDGGNSDFRHTKILAEKLDRQGFTLVDVGTSGGIWGYQNGFSMMVGSSDTESIKQLSPVFHSLAQPGGAWHHFGESGSGHFVKMVHNAIEYGIMESLAEGYRVLREGPYKALDLAAAGNIWQHHSVITSWLNELTEDALRENPDLNGIDGYVAESGEAKWTIETAKQAGFSLPSIEAAFEVRLRSQQGETNFSTQLLAAMRNKFGGHSLNKEL